MTVRLARLTGIPLWVWLIGSAIAGVYVLTNERHQFRMQTLAAFRGHENPLRALLDSGRRVLAGILLIAPG
ncbi:MAG: FxsA family protein, partial [Casimicrobiaceae bacterium]